jgi:hypothetical protein
VEGPAAREPEKSLNAITATAQTAATEANRSQSPLCLCKTPPHIYHPMFRLPSPGDGSRNICRLGRSIGSNDWDDRKLGDPEPNTVNSTRRAIRVVISELGREAARYRWQCGCP